MIKTININPHMEKLLIHVYLSCISILWFGNKYCAHMAGLCLWLPSGTALQIN